MKQILLLLLSIPTLLFSQSNTLSSITEDDMGTWAFSQHNQVSEKIIELINSRYLDVYETENTKMSEKKLYEKFYSVVSLFIQTDMNDPRIGKDSSFGFFAEQLIKSFKINKDFLEFNKKGQPWLLQKKEVYKFLSEEQLLYINQFNINSTIDVDSIPSKSKKLVQNINQNLISLCRSGKVNVYQSDSLKTSIAKENLKELGFNDVNTAVFISEDEWIDTIIKVDASVFTKNQKSIFFYNLSFQNSQFNIQSISPAVIYFLSNNEMPPLPKGYLKYNDIVNLSSKESDFIFKIIPFITMVKIAHIQFERESYNNYFQEKTKP